MNSGKKIVSIVAAIALVAVVLALTFDYVSGRKQEYQNNGVLSASIVANNQANSQTDSDSANPGNSQESQPQTSTSTAVSTSGANENDNPNSVNNTNKIGVDFFSQYLNMQQNGTVSDNDTDATATAEGLSSELLSVDNPSTPYTIYATSSIAVAPQETATIIEAYGNALGTIMLRDTPSNLQNELVVLDQASEQNDPALLDQLNTNIGAYQQVLLDYSQLTVPQSALALHMELLDTISQLSAADSAMQDLFTDPVSAASGFGSYNSAALELKDLVGRYESYFASKGVNFSPSSGGYSFTHLGQ